MRKLHSVAFGEKKQNKKGYALKLLEKFVFKCFGLFKGALQLKKNCKTLSGLGKTFVAFVTFALFAQILRHFASVEEG